MKNKIHYCLFKKMWSCHDYKKCTKTPSLLVDGDWITHVKPTSKSNPRGWVVCDHKQVTISPSEELVSQYEIGERLTYDKHNMAFNIGSGTNLLFNDNGCFILNKREQE